MNISLTQGLQLCHLCKSAGYIRWSRLGFLSTMASNSSNTPVLLLKTKSTPTDAYEDIFSKSQDGVGNFDTTFVPVLQHRFEEDGMSQLRSLLQQRQIHDGPAARYGGLIFTSQRAVEAFAKLVEEGKGAPSWECMT